MLLSTYNVQLPVPVTDLPSMCSDSVSLIILKHFHPALLANVYPAKTLGDGNCLYRAISRSLTGSESHHLLYRMFTSIEMLSNPMYYDTTHKKFVDLISDSRIFVAPYKELLTTATTPGAFSEMMHIYALSASIGQSLRSYFPPQLSMEFLSEPFSRKVSGRDVSKSSAPISTLMWTQIQPVTGSFSPNHFVPLLSKSANV